MYKQVASVKDLRHYHTTVCEAALTEQKQG